MQVSMKTLKYFISNNRRLFLCLVIAAGACCGFVQPTSAQEEASPKGDQKADAKQTGKDAVQESGNQESGGNQSGTGEGEASYVQLLTEWKGLEAKLKEMEAEYVVVAQARKNEIRKSYNEVLDKVRELVPRLRSEAIAAYQANPNKDLSLVRLLTGMLTDDLQKKRYDRFFALGKILVEGQCDLSHFEAIKKSKRLDEAINTTRFDAFDASEYVDELIARRGDFLKGDLPRAVIKTPNGDIEVELFEDVTPNHVANFISLASKGFYSNSEWHRVETPFAGQGLGLAQGGIPADGNRVDYTLEAEWDRKGRRKHFEGHLGAARLGGDNNSASSQFYIMTGNAPSLDSPTNSYTVFGRVVSGMEAARKIKRGDKMISVEVTRKREHPYEPVPYNKDAAKKDGAAAPAAGGENAGKSNAPPEPPAPAGDDAPEAKVEKKPADSGAKK